jgi:hypothetical protein
MSDADYEIVARLVAADATGAGIAGVHQKLDRLERRAIGFGSFLMRGFAAIGGAAGIGMAVRGMIGLNTQLDESARGMATLFTAFTGAPIEASFGRAQGVIKALSTDAKKGVGELSDYVGTFQALLGATRGSQADETLRKLTRNALAAGEAMMPGGQGRQLVANDLQQALTTGVSGVETPIVLRALQAMGLTTAKFNALKPDEKIEKLNEAFSKFGPGVELMGKSWSAQFSTMSDNVKDIIRTATAPVFARWTEHLRSANDWLAANEDRVQKIATVWGEKLLELWDHLIERAKIYAGLVAAGGLANTVGSGVMGAGGSLAKAAGATGAAAGIAGTGVGAGLLAGLLAVVAVGFVSVYTALADIPMLTDALAFAWNQLTTSFSHLLDSLSQFTAARSLLDAMGYALVGAVVTIVLAVDLLVRVLDTIAISLNALFQKLNLFVEAGRAMAEGDFGRARALMNPAVAMAIDKTATARIGETWKGFGLDDQFKRFKEQRELEADRKAAIADPTALPVPTHITNINGPVNVQVKAEANTDPTRIAFVFEEVLERVDRNRKQPRRPMRPAGT